MGNLEVIKPSFDVMTNVAGVIRHLERCGRTCYKSESKITNDSASTFIKKIIKLGHESVLEHSSISVRFICDRSCSHQIVRHRIGTSISMESQRYCNYKDRFQVIAPEALNIPFGKYYLFGSLGHIGSDTRLYLDESGDVAAPISHLQQRWLHNRFNDFQEYKGLLKYTKPEDARSVLPNATKTELVMTCNLRQWRHIIKERALNKHAQWQIKGLMLGVLNEFTSLLPEVFEDLR